jgi:translation initiation factor 1
MKEKKRLPTDGGPMRWSTPFAALKLAKLPLASPAQSVSDQSVSDQTRTYLKIV